MTTVDDDLAGHLQALSQIQKVSLALAVIGRIATTEAIEAASRTLDPALANNPDFQALTSEANEDPALRLEPETSAAVAEAFLMAAAKDPDLAPVLAAELAAFRDEKQFVLETLTLSACVSLIIVAATTRFEYRGEKVTILKEAASPGLVEAALGMVSKIGSAWIQP